VTYRFMEIRAARESDERGAALYLRIGKRQFVFTSSNLDHFETFSKRLRSLVVFVDIDTFHNL